MVALTGLTALEVEDVRYGFSGKVLHDSNNPVFVLLSNPSGQPWQGTVELTRAIGVQRRGGVIAINTALAPGDRRWVRLNPWMDAPGTEWRFRWQDPQGSRSYTAPMPEVVWERQVVVLADVDPRAGLPVFPSQLFPNSVSACDSLGAIVLDRLPRLQQAQRQALFDWYRAGGVIVLARNQAGQYPAIEELWRGLPAFASEDEHAGVLQQIPLQLVDIDRAALETRQLIPAPFEDDDYYYSNSDSIADKFHPALRDQSRPDHNWPLIVILLLLFACCLWPGAWLIGKFTDYRWTVFYLLASVVVFSLLIALVGRRGYGEQAAVHSIAWAHHLGESRYDVQQWSAVFVTTGGAREFAYTSPSSVTIGAGPSYDSEPLVADAEGAVALLNTPMFSNQAVVARGLLSDVNGVEVAAPMARAPQRNGRWDIGRLQISGPALADAVSVVVVSGSRFAFADLAEGHWAVRNLRPAQNFFDDLDAEDTLRIWGRWGGEQALDFSDRDVAQATAALVAGWRNGGWGTLNVPHRLQFTRPGQVQIYVLTVDQGVLRPNNAGDGVDVVVWQYDVPVEELP